MAILNMCANAVHFQYFINTTATTICITSVMYQLSHYPAGVSIFASSYNNLSYNYPHIYTNCKIHMLSSVNYEVFSSYFYVVNMCIKLILYIHGNAPDSISLFLLFQVDTSKKIP